MLAPAAAVPGQRLPPDAVDELISAELGSSTPRVGELCELLEHGSSAPRFGDLDAVRASDEVFPDLAHRGKLGIALRIARDRLRPGGLVVAAVPELANLRRLRPASTPPKVVGTGADREVTVQLWDWAPDGHTYTLELVKMRRAGQQWETATVARATHRVLSEREVFDALSQAGFVDVDRLPAGSAKYPLPLWVANAPG